MMAEGIVRLQEKPSKKCTLQIKWGGCPYEMHSMTDYSTYIFQNSVCACAQGLALPRASHSGEIALASPRRLRSTLAAALVLYAHPVVTEIVIGKVIIPNAERLTVSLAKVLVDCLEHRCACTQINGLSTQARMRVFTTTIQRSRTQAQAATRGTPKSVQ